MGRRGRPPGMPEPGSESFDDPSQPIEPAVPPTPPLRSTPEPEQGASRATEPSAPAPQPEDPPTLQQPSVPAASEPAEPRRAEPAAREPEPTFEDIFGTPTSGAPEPELPRADASRGRSSQPLASERSTDPSSDRDQPSAVDALADAVGASGSQTPWATATSATGDEPARAARERAPRPPRAKRQRSGRRGGVVIIVAIVAILAAVLGGGWLVFGPAIMDRFAEPTDYEGAGTAEVVVRIEQGWTGAQVAAMLEEEGVIADQEAFYDLLVADPSIEFQPGSYRLALEMSSQAALDALQDEASRVVLQVTIPEGFVLQQVFARLAEQTGIAEADIVQAASDPAAYGVPGSTLEGWLFPATYTFDGGTTPQQMLQAMVDRMRQALTDRGVPQERWQEVVTFASLVEREGGPVENFPQVARVFQNRLDIGMLLQSDATVHYGIGEFGVITTTDEERADANNPYNTYVYAGLPVGPIGAPGDAAIDAVLAPAEGDWLYFVTVDPSTGETVFSSTLAEHNQAVLRFQAWLRDHPEYGS